MPQLIETDTMTEGVQVVKTIRPCAQGMLASPSAFTAGVLEACASDADVLLMYAMEG